MNPERSYSMHLREYIQSMSEEVRQSDFNLLGEIADLLLSAKSKGKRLYLAGNGGSAATASHMANDLVKGCRLGDTPGLRAIALTDPGPVVTCLANDFCYEEIYSLQLETHAEPGDVLIVFSGSGNSPNILRAVEVGKKLGLLTVAFTGKGGGKLAGLCDVTLHAPTDSMERLEDMHLIYEHALVTVIRGAQTARGAV